MAADNKIAFFHGPTEKIAAGIKDGKINESDFVVSSDENILYYIDENKEAVPLGRDAKTQDEVTVKIGDGESIGGYADGDTLESGTDFNAFVKRLVQKRVPPEYVKPEVKMSVTSGSPDNVFEVGEMVSPTVKVEFIQNDAGALESITVKRGKINQFSSSKTPAEKKLDEFQVTDEPVEISALVVYSKGSVKENNLGEDDDEGIIEAGIVEPEPVKIESTRAWFYGSGDAEASDIDSAFVRALASGPVVPHEPMELNVTMKKGHKWVAAAVPLKYAATSIRYTNVGDPNMLDLFKRKVVQVEGANGFSAVGYNFYIYETACEASADMQFTFEFEEA